MESSRFGSSGNLSQTSSQLSETGQESTGGSELEESFHSYHSTGFHPSTNGQPRTNGHHPANGHATLGEQEIHRLSPEVGRGLKNDTPAERGSSKLQRYCFCSEFNILVHFLKLRCYRNFTYRLSSPLSATNSSCYPDSMMMGHHYPSLHPEFVGWRPSIKSGFSSER